MNNYTIIFNHALVLENNFNKKNPRILKINIRTVMSIFFYIILEEKNTFCLYIRIEYKQFIEIQFKYLSMKNYWKIILHDINFRTKRTCECLCKYKRRSCHLYIYMHALIFIVRLKYLQSFSHIFTRSEDGSLKYQVTIWGN